MTGDTYPTHRDCGGNAAAYALGALEPEEAQAFASHMTTCLVCRDEVTAFQGIVDALPLAATQMPAPPRLKRSLIASARMEPKTARASTQRVRGGGVRRTLARPALAAVGLAALVVAASAIALVALSSNRPGGSQLATRVIQASVAFPNASAIVRVGTGRAELVLRRFPAPPAGKVYEVWRKRNGHAPMPTSALFSVTSTGSAAVDVPGGIRGIDQVLVTPERLGGSLHPTHAPVIVAQIG